ncbi:MAG: NUDIX hydrolase [Parcubacteria group bacterium GW2011_GWA2_49_9]|nr:MAG: NUDIX hydrolase [Parcubacteria group bacterium GW2011_GWA2_49_9]
MNQPYISAKAVIVREDGNILALRRSKTCPRRPLSWDLPGGDVEFGEDLGQSIIREIKEEAGLVVPEVTLFDAIGFVAKDGDYWVTLGYVTRVPQDAAVVISWEHDQYEWITKEEFLQRESTDRIKRFLNNTNVRTESTKYENSNHPTSVLPSEEGRR